MKFINWFFVLCLLLSFTSCNNNKSSEIINNGTEVIEQKIEEIIPEENDIGEPILNDFSYNLLKPIVSSKEVFNYQELELPSKVNGLEMSIWLIFDKQRLLVVLYDDTHIAKSKEIGFYNFVTNEYETLFTIKLEEGQESRSVSICDIEGTNILYIDSIFKDINDMLGTHALHVFNTETKKDIKILTYSKDYNESGAGNTNKVVLYEGMVYYDEVEMTNGELSGINLYRFDLKSEKISLVQKWAQNPTVYDGELFFVAKYDTSEDFYFQSLDENTKIMLTNRISELAPVGSELYTINNKYLDEKRRLTVWNIVNLITDEELLTSTIAIDRLEGNNNLLTWMNFFPEKPVVYLKTIEKFIVFDEFEKGYSWCLFNDDLCILGYYNDNQATKYYILKTK